MLGEPDTIFTDVDPSTTAVTLNPASDELFIVFAGAAGRTVETSRPFLQRTRLLERNVVMVRDRRDRFYLDGLSSQMHSYELLRDWLRSARTRLRHVRRTYCVGSCMGAYAAMMFGHDLDVDAVWAFSPHSKLPATLAAAHPGRNDLCQILRGRQSRTRHHLYYSSALPSAIEAAKALAQTGNICLHPQPGDRQQVIETMIEIGTIDALFSDADCARSVAAAEGPDRAWPWSSLRRLLFRLTTHHSANSL